MRSWLLMMAVVVPFAVQAADEPSTDWHSCSTEADCVMVPGICGEAAVNGAYRNEAAAFYAAKAQDNHTCSTSFWKPKVGGSARCRLERCEVTYEPKQ